MTGPYPSDSNSALPTLREYLEHIIKSLRDLIDERDRRYEERDKSNKDAVKLAFTAMDKASESTAEALKEYKATANEWRATLSDFTAKAASKDDVDRRFDELSKQIASLRESRSAFGGGVAAENVARNTKHWVIGTLVTVGIGLAVIVIAIMKMGN